MKHESVKPINWHSHVTGYVSRADHTFWITKSIRVGNKRIFFAALKIMNEFGQVLAFFWTVTTSLWEHINLLQELYIIRYAHLYNPPNPNTFQCWTWFTQISRITSLILYIVAYILLLALIRKLSTGWIQFNLLDGGVWGGHPPSGCCLETWCNMLTCHRY